MKTAVRLDALVHDDLDLLQLELEIARRADELRRFSVGLRDLRDRECWLRAEAEVFETRGVEFAAVA